MKKQTKIIIGLGAVSILGYLIWKQNRKKSFANASGRDIFSLPANSTCPKGYVTIQGITHNAPVLCVPKEIYSTHTNYHPLPSTSTPPTPIPIPRV